MPFYYSYFPSSMLLLEGRDARDFLYRLSSVDVHSIEEKEGKCALFLRSSSEIIATTHIIRKNRISIYCLRKKL